ncbi:hypothetical protein GPJ56_005637 [Histomonas meleagridis]|uniref:uncharacterized protein n=1 Tax=Histomonas meleagridis TaxID=135588 RepID=UPI0035598ABE|nr:hypothetical protein GPJ56_005637 [Histomonas meleagridis]KAH0803428.1 hypothetical protein GO595_003772 [Histomonas meleagridis]
MTLAHLTELGDQILRSIEGDQLQTEIAMISLESIHKMIVLNPSIPQFQDNQPIQYQGYPQSTNMFYNQSAMPSIAPQEIPYQFDGKIPRVMGAALGNDIITQSLNDIPFLYHKKPD